MRLVWAGKVLLLDGLFHLGVLLSRNFAFRIPFLENVERGEMMVFMVISIPGMVTVVPSRTTNHPEDEQRYPDPKDEHHDDAEDVKTDVLAVELMGHEIGIH